MVVVGCLWLRGGLGCQKIVAGIPVLQTRGQAAVPALHSGDVLLLFLAVNVKSPGRDPRSLRHEPVLPVPLVGHGGQRHGGALVGWKLATGGRWCAAPRGSGRAAGSRRGAKPHPGQSSCLNFTKTIRG